jgi:hypothetical protein
MITICSESGSASHHFYTAIATPADSHRNPQPVACKMMSRWCDRSTTRDPPINSMALLWGRTVVWNPCRGNHLGQRSCASASTGRTYGGNDLTKPLQNTLRGGGRPHMSFPPFGSSKKPGLTRFGGVSRNPRTKAAYSQIQLPSKTANQLQGPALGDLGYRGKRLAEAGQALGITVEAIARGRDGQFIPVGICWVVERSLPGGNVTTITKKGPFKSQ